VNVRGRVLVGKKGGNRRERIEGVDEKHGHSGATGKPEGGGEAGKISNTRNPTWGCKIHERVNTKDMK